MKAENHNTHQVSNISFENKINNIIMNKNNSKEVIRIFHFLIQKIINNERYQENCIFTIVKPKISFFEYLTRILKYCKLHLATVIFSLVYIDRLPDNFILTDNNIHKIVLTSILLACKINEDIIHSNLYFSKVGGINLFDINLLENDLLNLIKFNLFVDDITFNKYMKYFNKIHQ